MEYFSAEYVLWAVALGGISAVSLPLGSLFGMRATVRPAQISVLAAFGAGALIAALSIELVAPTLFALEGHGGNSHPGDPYAGFFALVIGAAVGGVLFTLLDRALRGRGAFLRRASSTITHFSARRHDRQLALLEELAHFPVLKDLSTEHVNSLMEMIRPMHYPAGETIAREGDAPTGLLFIADGDLEASRADGLRAEAGAGNVVGVMPLIMGLSTPATLIAREAISGYSLSLADFDRLRELAPEFDQAMRGLAVERVGLIEDLMAERDQQSHEWLEQARRTLTTGARMPDAIELRRQAEEHTGAPLAIWLGILLDGIPESFVIGAGLLVLLQSQAGASISFAEVIPYTLIAGVFLSNFPEALASSANMRRLGWSKRRVFLLWFSLLVMTALGAGAGFLLADSLSHTWVVFAEGLAAGAMLTMIAAAMIPEAVYLGSANAVGLSTLTGFLAAIAFKLLG